MILANATQFCTPEAIAGNLPATLPPRHSRPTTWQQLVTFESELEELAREGRRWRLGRRGDWRRYEIIKARLKHLVGRQARRPELRTDEAWTTAHSVIFGGGQ